MTVIAETTVMRAASRGPWLLEIEARVMFSGPLHVGTGERLGLGGDAPLLRDERGHVWLPGSSVRGVFRDWCEREAPLLGVSRAAVLRLFGATPDASRGTTADQQGRLRVFDARLGATRTEIRDHVRIDRAKGGARRGGKFDLESADLRTATLALTYEGDGANDEEVLLLRAGVAALEAELFAFGAKSGWGLGAAKGVAEAWETDRRTRQGCAHYLLSRLAPGEVATPPANPGIRRPFALAAPDYDRAVPRPRITVFRSSNGEAHELEPRSWSWMTFDLRLQFEGPLLVAGVYRPSPGMGEIEREADATYITTPAGAPLLPGSSLRGTLRSHAERIATTLGCEESTALVLFGTEEQRGLLRVGEGTLDGQPRPIFLNHVAIDRVSGFAADKKLFSAAGLESPAFTTRLTVLWDHADEQHRAAVGLALFALRDAQASDLWIGSRTTSGYGWLKQMVVKRIRRSVVVDDSRRFDADLADVNLGESDTLFQPFLESWRSMCLKKVVGL